MVPNKLYEYCNFTSENKYKLLKKIFIYIDTKFMDHQINIYENSNFNPSTPYAGSKLAGDLHLTTLYKKFDHQMYMAHINSFII